LEKRKARHDVHSECSIWRGITALKQAQETQPDVPVILISGTVGEEDAVKVLHIGATDYLLKDRLAPAVQRALQEAETRRTRGRAEAALGQSEARKAAILDSVLDSIVTMDADGMVIEFNAAAERIFGYTKAEAIGRPLADLIIPPRLRDAHTAGLARYLATGEGHLLGKLIEITAVRSNGSDIPVELAITAIRSDKARYYSPVSCATFRRASRQTRPALVWQPLSTRRTTPSSARLWMPTGKTAELTAILEKAARCRTALRVHGKRNDRSE
jgi:PAS domain S-box-containing protein